MNSSNLIDRDAARGSLPYPSSTFILGFPRHVAPMSAWKVPYSRKETSGSGFRRKDCALMIPASSSAPRKPVDVYALYHTIFVRTQDYPCKLRVRRLAGIGAALTRRSNTRVRVFSKDQVATNHVCKRRMARCLGSRLDNIWRVYECMQSEVKPSPLT